MEMIPRSQTGVVRPRSAAAPSPSYAAQPAQQVRGYRLQIMQGEEYGKIYDLTQMVNQGLKRLTVGRQSDNNVYVKSDFSDYLSRHHCTIEPDTGQWRVLDGQWSAERQCWVESTNGTCVNSWPVSKIGFFLKSGDIISMGDVTMRFEAY